MPVFNPQNPQSYFQSGPSYLDPGSMAFYNSGISGNREQFNQLQNNYASQYFQNHGAQAQAQGSPRNYWDYGANPAQQQYPAQQNQQAGMLSQQPPNGALGTSQGGNAYLKNGNEGGSLGQKMTNPEVPAQNNEFSQGMERMLQRSWQPTQFTQQYGNYGAQFPNQNTQTGAAMYSNIMPRGYTPPWAMSSAQMTPRLQGSGYLNGGSLANYGMIGGNPASRQIGNPYPGSLPYANGNQQGFNNPYMNVPQAPGYPQSNHNPFLGNQNGGQPFGLPRPQGNQQAMMPGQDPMGGDTHNGNFAASGPRMSLPSRGGGMPQQSWSPTSSMAGSMPSLTPQMHPQANTSAGGDSNNNYDAPLNDIHRSQGYQSRLSMTGGGMPPQYQMESSHGGQQPYTPTGGASPAQQSSAPPDNGANNGQYQTYLAGNGNMGYGQWQGMSDQGRSDAISGTQGMSAVSSTPPTQGMSAVSASPPAQGMLGASPGMSMTSPTPPMQGGMSMSSPNPPMQMGGNPYAQGMPGSSVHGMPGLNIDQQGYNRPDMSWSQAQRAIPLNQRNNPLGIAYAQMMGRPWTGA